MSSHLLTLCFKSMAKINLAKATGILRICFIYYKCTEVLTTGILYNKDIFTKMIYSIFNNLQVYIQK